MNPSIIDAKTTSMGLEDDVKFQASKGGGRVFLDAQKVIHAFPYCFNGWMIINGLKKTVDQGVARDIPQQQLDGWMGWERQLPLVCVHSLAR
jgi:hypothetical protein